MLLRLPLPLLLCLLSCRARKKLFLNGMGSNVRATSACPVALLIPLNSTLYFGPFLTLSFSLFLCHSLLRRPSYVSSLWRIMHKASSSRVEFLGHSEPRFDLSPNVAIVCTTLVLKKRETMLLASAVDAYHTIKWIMFWKCQQHISQRFCLIFGTLRLIFEAKCRKHRQSSTTIRKTKNAATNNEQKRRSYAMDESATLSEL